MTYMLYPDKSRSKKSLPFLERICICTFLFCFVCFYSWAQDKTGAENKAVVLRTSDTIRIDSSKIIEAAPLDIAENRGLFISTEDGKMQLRILGSVRYLAVYDEFDLTSKNGFNTFEIPTGDANKKIPNYYNDLEQSRLGFEVTRKTEDGDIFIRLETDFAGENGFRIRHAYGQFRRFLFGQTWSLFSHINSLPSMVDFAGPTASVVQRTPQIRYTVQDAFKDINLAVGLEYIIPDLNIPDSLSFESFQLIPDITIRLDKDYPWGSAQLSAVIPMLSGRNDSGSLILKPGWGISASSVLNSWKQGKWYFQGAIGNGIMRYFNDLDGNGLDFLYDQKNKFYSPLSVGFYGTYEHSWREKLLSNFTFGWLHVEQFPFSEDESYRYGYSVRANTFWSIVEGAKIGAELIWGHRENKDWQGGNAMRLNMLVYYDF